MNNAQRVTNGLGGSDQWAYAWDTLTTNATLDRQEPMNLFAFALFLVWFGGAFVWRTAMQQRMTGDTGIRWTAVGPDASSAERWAAGLFAVALVMGLIAPVAAMLGLGPLWQNDLWRLAGAGIALIGVGLTFMAQAAMGPHWRIGVDSNEKTELVTSGMFSVVRNPIFSAMMLSAIGFFAMVPNVFSAIATMAIFAAIEIQVRKVEEPHLRRQHGKAYDDYTEAVGRFVPYIGRGVVED